MYEYTVSSIVMQQRGHDDAFKEIFLELTRIPIASERRAALIEGVRAAYVSERLMWLLSRGGGPQTDYAPSTRWDTTWPKMADFMLKHKISDYLPFIHEQFLPRGNRACCPTPKACYSRIALRRWKEVQAGVVADIRVSLQRQQLRWTVELAREAEIKPHYTLQQCENHVLTDDANTLTPLFRYCLAVIGNCRVIAAAYRDEALKQYILAREIYDQVFGDNIPAELRQEAELFVFAICGGRWR